MGRGINPLYFMLALLAMVAVPVALLCYVVSVKLPAIRAVLP